MVVPYLRKAGLGARWIFPLVRLRWRHLIDHNVFLPRSITLVLPLKFSNRLMHEVETELFPDIFDRDEEEMIAEWRRIEGEHERKVHRSISVFLLDGSLSLSVYRRTARTCVLDQHISIVSQWLAHFSAIFLIFTGSILAWTWHLFAIV